MTSKKNKVGGKEGNQQQTELDVYLDNLKFGTKRNGRMVYTFTLHGEDDSDLIDFIEQGENLTRFIKEALHLAKDYKGKENKNNEVHDENTEPVYSFNFEQLTELLRSVQPQQVVVENNEKVIQKEIEPIVKEKQETYSPEEDAELGGNLGI